MTNIEAYEEIKPNQKINQIDLETNENSNNTFEKNE